MSILATVVPSIIVFSFIGWLVCSFDWPPLLQMKFIMLPSTLCIQQQRNNQCLSITYFSPNLANQSSTRTVTWILNSILLLLLELLICRQKSLPVWFVVFNFFGDCTADVVFVVQVIVKQWLLKILIAAIQRLQFLSQPLLQDFRLWLRHSLLDIKTIWWRLRLCICLLIHLQGCIRYS